eukprot:CCRYP_001342-RA/>CCRYP_001342-RA protein AED:0.00 eAED:-0.00 QI:52/1/0.5/1/0/0.5/2/0/260
MNDNGKKLANDIVEPLLETLGDTLNSKNKDVNVKLSFAKSSSAFNLFYQYSQIIQNSCETLDEIPPSSYGLEHIVIESSPILMMASDEEIITYRKAVIEQTLHRNQCIERDRTNNTKSNQRCSAEPRKHIVMKWQEADKSTKRIFREMAKENSERRQCAECKLFKAGSAHFYMKPVTEMLPLPDNSADVKPPSKHFPTQNCVDPTVNNDVKLDLEYRQIGNISTDPLTSSTDWTPLPFNHKFDEMNIVEFNDMLSNFDWN